MSERFSIEGGVPLRGAIRVRGSKNAASKLLVASLLSDQPSHIENVPLSAEIEITRELCEIVGARVSFYGERSCEIETKDIKTPRVLALSRRNRVPILALGPLLHRAKRAEVPVPGGDAIGHRPIDFHIAALEKMGVRFERRPDSYYAEADTIRGADITLPYPSVGATENILLTAVIAAGRTVIQNAAVEPEILNLVEMLRGMGARIEARPEERLYRIEGVSSLSGVRVRAIPDRNEIVSFASAALATKGDVTIEGGDESLITAYLGVLKAAGGGYEKRGDDMRFFFRGTCRSVSIETAPHPGFMTDWQQPFAVVLAGAEGESVIHETVYSDRFGYTADLKRMGADIEVFDDCGTYPSCRFFAKGYKHTARIRGPRTLRGARIEIRDIRAGIAHVVAALAATGESVIEGVHHLDRGYEKIDERLAALGARIRRIHE